VSIHLARNVCDGCRVWCQFDRNNIGDTIERDDEACDHYADGYDSDPAKATCRNCLATAVAYGEACARRLDECFDPTYDDEECTR
jgi:hypothetical protein